MEAKIFQVVSENIQFANNFTIINNNKLCFSTPNKIYYFMHNIVKKTRTNIY